MSRYTGLWRTTYGAGAYLAIVVYGAVCAVWSYAAYTGVMSVQADPGTLALQAMGALVACLLIAAWTRVNATNEI